ncbi:hypothetical protein IGI04_022711, partial [Brassica rapa subsp. trilocularis]
RAEHGSEVPQRRHEVAPKHPPRATCPERRPEVARISHPSQSDLPKRHPEVARVSMARRHEAKPGATSQSDPLRSLPKAGATCRSDMPSSILDHPRSNPYAHEFSFPLVKKEDPLAVNEVEGLEGQEELCFINNNGSWYKKEPNFQYNNYQQKSYPNNQQSGYQPRNNQQGSYQPQQNPSFGSSAPQESSTDTLLKQILESQTRSEKHVGYELKNLHSKIDGSYNELNNKFSHLASTVIIGRAEHGSEVPQRRHEVAPKHPPERRPEVARISHPSQSDLPKRHPEVARVSMARRHEAKPGATSQSDPLRSLPKAGATCRSDMPRSLRSLLRIVSRLKVDSLIDHLPSLVRYLITQGLIPMPMSSLFP